jgi:hypothetical protein
MSEDHKHSKSKTDDLKIYESNLLMMDQYGYYPSTASYNGMKMKSI